MELLVAILSNIFTLFSVLLYAESVVFQLLPHIAFCLHIEPTNVPRCYVMRLRKLEARQTIETLIGTILVCQRVPEHKSKLVQNLINVFIRGVEGSRGVLFIVPSMKRKLLFIAFYMVAPCQQVALCNITFPKKFWSFCASIDAENSASSH